MPEITYAVLGGGMQGTAAAYDIARFGDAARIHIADVDGEAARRSAERVNGLIGRELATAVRLDVADAGDVAKLLEECAAACSAVPYRLNLAVTEAAIAARCSLTDLGGNTDVVKAQHRLSDPARDAGVTIVPDCGLAPGMGNTLAAHGLDVVEGATDVRIRCGGLPLHPKPPLDYKLVFSIGGLTNEYFGTAWEIRDGQVVSVPTFSGLEELDFDDPVGRCEAFITTGGTSTCPWTYEGKLRSYSYKTVRYPGHHAKIKLLLDLGFLDEAPVAVAGVDQPVSPRAVFHSVVPPHIDFPEDPDLVVLRVTVSGPTDRITMDILDHRDSETGFTAMERTTAYPASIVTIMAAKGELARGVSPLETAVPGAAFIEALERRGIPVRVRREPLDQS
jgi:lysine 6-dehydrogenase